MSGKIIKGTKLTFAKETRGLGEYFFEAAEKYGEKICQINAHTGVEETYHSVKQRSVRLAVQMRRLGVNEDDVILFCTKNTPDSTVVVLATLYLGAKVVPLDPSYALKVFIHCISTVRPKFVFVEEDSVGLMEGTINEVANKTEIIVIGKSTKYKTFSDLQMPVLEETDFRPVQVRECHGTAMIYFSSGTTGLPKGVCITHYGMVNGMRALLEMDHYNPAIMMTYISLYAITAFMVMTISFVAGGCRVLAQTFDPENFLQLIEKYKVTYTYLAPSYTCQLTSLQDAEKYNTSSLYSVMVGGAPIDPEQIVRTRRLFRHSYVSAAYGSSESSTMTTGYDYTRDKLFLDTKLRSAGRCSPDIEIKVVDLESGQPLGPNQRGEIRVKCEYSTSGYYNLDPSVCFDDEGFIRSGDIGYYDEDEFVFVVDRINATFKCMSSCVFPSFLEELLQRHPEVEEAGVFGLPHEIDGFHPAACVVLRPGRSADAGEIADFVAGRVEEWQKLRGGVKFVGSLPKSPVGKVKRGELEQLFMNN